MEEKLVVAPDGSLYCGGVGGILRLVLPDDLDGEVRGEIVFPDKNARLALSRDGRQALIMAGLANAQYYVELHLLDLETRASRRITTHGNRLISVAFDPSGTAIVTGDWDGIVRVGPASGEEPHLLLGHAEGAYAVATSPDGRWIASASDGMVILWPMPDVTQPPLHVLPHDALMAKLEALTNLRVVADPSTSTGWKTEIGPFPGWKDVPSW